MFKKAMILGLVLLLCSTVFSVRLIDPLSKELSLTQTNFAGTVAPGNTIELIFSKELVDKYESIDLLTALPAGFDHDVKVEMESLKLFIHVPKNANAGDYPFSIQLSGPSKSDKVPLSFEVVKGSISASPADISEASVSVGSKAAYKLFFVNNTDSDAVFTVTDNLPSNWMDINPLSMNSFSKVIIVPKRASMQENLDVYPRLQGKKDFTVNVAYEDTSKNFSFSVNAIPTIKSKLESSIFGLPFYSFSLVPNYFVNGLLSFFTN